MVTERILFRQGDKGERSFSPIYLAILSGIILIILIFNGILEINRAKNGFYLLLNGRRSSSSNTLRKIYKKLSPPSNC